MESEREAFRLEKLRWEEERRSSESRSSSAGSQAAEMEGVVEIASGPQKTVAAASRVPRRSFVPRPLEEKL